MSAQRQAQHQSNVQQPIDVKIGQNQTFYTPTKTNVSAWSWSKLLNLHTRLCVYNYTLYKNQWCFLCSLFCYCCCFVGAEWYWYWVLFLFCEGRCFLLIFVWGFIFHSFSGGVFWRFACMCIFMTPFLSKAHTCAFYDFFFQKHHTCAFLWHHFCPKHHIMASVSILWHHWHSNEMP